MTVVALVSAKSGGVTVSALALALAAQKETVLAELDPSGGTIRPGFQQGQCATAQVGLHRLATAQRSGTLGQVFHEHLVTLDGTAGHQFLPGLTDPAQASAMTGVWEQLVRAWSVLESDRRDVVVDAGRVVVDSGELSQTRSPAAVLRHADVVLLVVRQTLAHVVASRDVAALLARDLERHGTGADALGLLLVGEDNAPPVTQISHNLGLPVLARFDWDPATARALSHGPRSGRDLSSRSTLLRQARSSWDQITALANRRKVQLSPSTYGSVYQGGGQHG